MPTNIAPVAFNKLKDKSITYGKCSNSLKIYATPFSVNFVFDKFKLLKGLIFSNAFVKSVAY